MEEEGIEEEKAEESHSHIPRPLLVMAKSPIRPLSSGLAKK